jgi:hypothetical protein
MLAVEAAIATRSIIYSCIGRGGGGNETEECYVTIQIPVAVVLVVLVGIIAPAVLMALLCFWRGGYRFVTKKQLDPMMMMTETFLFHDDIHQLLKESGVKVTACAAASSATTPLLDNKNKNTGNHCHDDLCSSCCSSSPVSKKNHNHEFWSHLSLSSRLDAKVALMCLAQVQEAHEQLEQVKNDKEQELAALRDSIHAAAARLEEAYERQLLDERYGKEQLELLVRELQVKLAQHEAQANMHAKTLKKLEARKELVEELQQKVMTYERRLETTQELEMLRKSLAEQLGEWQQVVHSSVNLSETNRHLTSQVERVVTKLNGEAGRIHAVSITPEGQLRGKVIKSSSSSSSLVAHVAAAPSTTLSVVTSLSSAASAITTTTPTSVAESCTTEQQRHHRRHHHRLPANPNRLFGRKAGGGSSVQNISIGTKTNRFGSKSFGKATKPSSVDGCFTKTVWTRRHPL